MFNWIKGSGRSWGSKTVEHLSLVEQQNLLIDWASNSEMEPQWRREIMRQISKMDKVLSDPEFDLFIAELSKLKLGIDVTLEEAETIIVLCRIIEEAKVAMENGGSKADYEKARADLQSYQANITEV